MSYLGGYFGTRGYNNTFLNITLPPCHSINLTLGNMLCIDEESKFTSNPPRIDINQNLINTCYMYDSNKEPITPSFHNDVPSSSNTYLNDDGGFLAFTPHGPIEYNIDPLHPNISSLNKDLHSY